MGKIQDVLAKMLDTFKKSLGSQSFLQTDATQHLSVDRVLRKAAQDSGDSRLFLLASTVKRQSNGSMATGSHFDKVIAAIDEMVNTLQGEEATDLDNKEVCEKDRADDTRT